MTTDRLPAATDAERYIVGVLVAFPECAVDVFSRLRPSDFGDDANRDLFAALAEQHTAGGGIDPVLACRQLKGRPLFRGTEPAVMLMEMAAAVQTAHHVPREASRIIEARRKRELFELSDAIRSASLNGETASTIVYDARSVLSQLERDAPHDRPRPVPIGDLCADHPRLRPPVIDRLMRQGEIANIVAPSKFGKSWLAYGLILCECAASPWFGVFNTSGGRVLLVDNELHPSTLAYRIPAVADAMALSREAYEDRLDVLSLRGRLRPFGEVADEIAGRNERYSLIVMDAKYRFIAPGASENDNSAETQFYNIAEEFTDRTGAALVFVHHSTKGSQSDKRVTDVGAGAGAQSRAADCHIVLREHEEEGVCVLDAALRSFAPIRPIALRWSFPLWVPADAVDPARLKRPPMANEQRQRDRDKEGVNAIAKELLAGPLTVSKLREGTGISRERLQRLLDGLVFEKKASYETTKVEGNNCRVYTLCE